ncbi:MAG: hypothetical protein IPJ20_23585 [Flammeovirgaceae bacterium]|nr:hypothetical protein [Flammeovirgaceae bacterium]
MVKNILTLPILIEIQKSIMLALAEFDNSPRLKSLHSIVDFIFLIREKPLQKKVIINVGKKFRFNNTQLAEVVGVSVRAFHRKKPTDTISIDASEITMRLAELYRNGLSTFDNDEKSFLQEA